MSKALVTLREGDNYETDKHSLWIIQADEVVGGAIDFDPLNRVEGSCWLKPGERGLLVSSSEVFHISAGQMSVSPLLNVQPLCKLQAFLDTAFGLIEPEILTYYGAGGFWRFISQADGEGTPLQHIKNLMIRQAVKEPNEMKSIASVLRRMECYWLTRFLIQQSDGAERVQDLGALYGVSTSHFRRLSSQALGNAVKAELRAWRLSRALLDLMGANKSLTDVAMRHGYASLSHFSTDVKQLCGMSPGKLKKFNISEL